MVVELALEDPVRLVSRHIDVELVVCLDAIAVLEENQFRVDQIGIFHMDFLTGF